MCGTEKIKVLDVQISPAGGEQGSTERALNKQRRTSRKPQGNLRRTRGEPEKKNSLPNTPGHVTPPQQPTNGVRLASHDVTHVCFEVSFDETVQNKLPLFTTVTFTLL